LFAPSTFLQRDYGVIVRLKPYEVLASALAALAAAVAASVFGVKGTLVGAAFGAAIATTVASLVAQSAARAVASRDWCKNRLTRFLSIILRGGCNSLVDHLLIVLSVIGRDQLVPQVL
jgi:hypothetical protein